MKPAEKRRARSATSGFTPAKITGEGDARGWLDRNSSSSTAAGGGRQATNPALRQYLDGGWRETNKALRAQKNPPEGVDQIDAAFTPLAEDVVLRRQVPLAMFAHIPIKDLEGMKVRDAAYASTSLDRPDAGPSAPDAVTMHIAAAAGTPAYVNAPDGEVLLARDTEVAITRAEPNGRGGWDLYGVVIPKTAVKRDSRASGRDDDNSTTAPDTDQPDDNSTTAPDTDQPDDNSTTAPDTDQPGGDDTTAPDGDFDSRIAGAARQADALRTLPIHLDRLDEDWDGEIGRYSAEEIADALETYKGNDHNDINHALRNDTLNREGLGSGRAWRETVQKIDAAMEESRLPRDTELWRGILYPQGIFGDAWNDRDVSGLEFSDAAYTSTSVTERAARDFAHAWSEHAEGATDRVVMRVLAPAGTGAVGISELTWEGEVLLQRGLRFRVVADSGVQNNVRRLDVEVLTPASPAAQREDADRRRDLERMFGETPRVEVLAPPTATGSDAPTGDVTPAAGTSAPSVVYPDPPEMPDNGPLGGFQSIDRERIRIAVEDQAPGIFRSPATGGSMEDVVRYIADSNSLDPLTARYGRPAVWEAVDQYVTERPDLVTRHPNVAMRAGKARTDRVNAMASQAAQLTKAGDFTAALELIDQAERLAPDQRTGTPVPTRTWDDLRGIIRRRAGQGPAAADAAGPAGTPTATAGPKPVTFPRLWHTAPAASAASIRDGGFKAGDGRGPDGDGGGGAFFGAGVYLSTDQAAADRYLDGARAYQYSDAEQLTARARVTNPFIVNATRTDADPGGLMRRHMVDAGLAQPGERLTPREITERLQRAGHDGVEVRQPDPNDEIGGSQLLVFDPADVELSTPDRDQADAPDTSTGDGTPAAGTSAPDDAPDTPRRRAAGPPPGVDEQRRKDYERGWAAARRGANLDYADARSEPDAWYEGYGDQATGRPKWNALRQQQTDNPPGVDPDTGRTTADVEQPSGDVTPAAGTSAPTGDTTPVGPPPNLTRAGRLRTPDPAVERSRLDAAAGGFTPPPRPEITGRETGNDRRRKLDEIGLYLNQIREHIEWHEADLGRDYYSDQIRRSYNEARADLDALSVTDRMAANRVGARLDQLMANLRRIETMAVTRDRRARLTRSPEPDPANNPADAVLAIEDVLRTNPETSGIDHHLKTQLEVAAQAIEGGMPVADASTLVRNLAARQQVGVNGQTATRRLRDLYAALTGGGDARPTQPRPVDDLEAGDHVTVSGRTPDGGQDQTVTGYVVSVSTTRRGGVRAVTVAERPDGSGRRDTIHAAQDATATPATEPGSTGDETPAAGTNAPDAPSAPPAGRPAADAQRERRIAKLEGDLERYEVQLERARAANRGNLRSRRELQIADRIDRTRAELLELRGEAGPADYSGRTDKQLRDMLRNGDRLTMAEINAIGDELRRRRTGGGAPSGDVTPAAGTNAPDGPDGGPDTTDGPAGPDGGGTPRPDGPDRTGPTGPATNTPDGPAQQADMFGGTTEFVPAPRSAIGLAERPNVGRERAIAAVQQLGLFADESREMDGQMAMLDALLDMPAGPAAAPPPNAPQPAAPDAPAPVSLVPDDIDLADWSDEQLADLFRQVSNADGQLDEAGLGRIAAEWDRREAAMQALVASVPEDLTVLPETDVMDLYARVTGGLGTMDHPTVERLGAELDRRQEAERLAEVNAPKRALLDRPVTDLTDDEIEVAAGYAADLGDVEAIERVFVEWDRRDREKEAAAAREAAEREAAAAAEREAAQQAVREAEQRAAAEHAAARRDRMVDAMAASQEAAIVPAYDDTAVSAAVTVVDEPQLRQLFGDATVDGWLATAAGDSAEARLNALIRGSKELPAAARVRLVSAAADTAGERDLRDDSDSALQQMITAGMFASPNDPEYARKRGWMQRAAREKNRRKVQTIRDGSAREFRQWQIRAMAADPARLTDEELEVAPTLVTATDGGADFDTPGRLAALRAEAQRRELAAVEAAEAKAAGPAGPARYVNPVREYGSLQLLVRGGSPKDRQAEDRLRRAQAAVYGLPEDADAKAIKAAAGKDPRPYADQAATITAWYRHLAQHEGVADTELEWYRGKPDDPDAPETPTPAPPANVAKPREVWQRILDNARAEVEDGRYETAARVARALARTYRIRADDVEPNLDSIRRLQAHTGPALHGDTRTEAQRAADFIAQFRVLAAEDGVDPSDTLRYGPPDKGTRRAGGRSVWRESTPDQQARIDELVARGWDWLDAYAEVHGADVAQLRAERARTSSGGDAGIRQAYAEYVELQYLAAEAATAGNLLTKRAASRKVDPRRLFSGPSAAALANASEELKRWWGDNPRLTYADFRAQLLGGDDARQSRERLVTAGKGNEFV